MMSQKKIQPLDAKSTAMTDPARPAGKSRLKRLFERQFQRVSSAEKLAADGLDLEPGTVNLDRMVLSFIEGGNEKTPGRRRCNCFNGNFDDNSDDDNDGDTLAPAPVSAAEILKGLVQCVSQLEMTLLADASRIAEKGWNRDESRREVWKGLQSLGYEASVCKSLWEKKGTIPDGEYEFIDVIAGAERVIIDVDFRSEFEIARSTKNYRTVLQSVPAIFVGKADRLGKIVAVIAEAARQSMKKKGLHLPPWRKSEYMKLKWLSPYYCRTEVAAEKGGDGAGSCPVSTVTCSGDSSDKITVTVTSWQLPAVQPKMAGARVVTGLAAVLGEN